MKHYGSIPGIPIGTVFRDRAELHASGGHAPLMAGISGSSTEAADSVVVSGGYEDDVDLGDTILYTGQGGNDPATNQQVADQELVRGNMGLVKSLLEGRPVRVIRGANPHSQYAPERGYRYEGLFAVEDYWRDIGKSGYLIWRFRLRKLEGVLSPLPLSPQPSERHEFTVSRIIRNTAVAQHVKALHRFACQACGVILETPGGRYAEAAHIRPLGKPHDGPDVKENILCLCPNDHLLFDVGAFHIGDDFSLIERPGRLRVLPAHPLAVEYLRYHREHFGVR